MTSEGQLLRHFKFTGHALQALCVGFPSNSETINNGAGVLVDDRGANEVLLQSAESGFPAHLFEEDFMANWNRGEGLRARGNLIGWARADEVVVAVSHIVLIILAVVFPKN